LPPVLSGWEDGIMKPYLLTLLVAMIIALADLVALRTRQFRSGARILTSLITNIRRRGVVARN
jgi:hypothetical protein